LSEYPDVTVNWALLFDVDADSSIDFEEWKAYLTLWHDFEYVSVWDASISDFVSLYDNDYMAYFLEVSKTAFETWYLNLDYAAMMAQRSMDPAVNLPIYTTWNQVIDGNLFIAGIATDFAAYTMVADSNITGFAIADSSMDETKFDFFDWNNDDMIDLEEYT
jgi:hypothetical protein